VVGGVDEAEARDLRGEGLVRIQVGDPELMGPLLEYFDQRAECVWAKVGPTEIEVSLLGSYRNELHDVLIQKLVSQFRREGGAARDTDLRLVGGVAGPRPGRRRLPPRD
jgi:hypothetical protein